MEVEGKVIFDLGERSGVSKAGNNWKAHEYVLETKDTYPKKIAFEFFGERADQYPLQAGDEIRLFFDVESREYQGRWFTSIRGYKTESLNAGAAVPPPPAVDPLGTGWGNAPVPPPPAQAAGEDLPF